MNFLAPEMLLGLLLIPIAIGFYLWAQRRRSKYAVRFTNLALLSNLAPKRPSWRRHLPPVLYLGAIAALLIGLARPTMIVPVPREDATVILTMDVSGSMRATDVSPTRLDAARASALSFIDQLPEKVRVGIVSFASEPTTLVSPTTDRAQLKAALDSLTARDGTAMGDALMQVLDIAEKIQKDAPETPDASCDARARPPRPTRPPPAPRSCRSTSHRTSRSSPRSCCPTAPTRSARPNRSTRPPGPRRSACRSTPSRSGPRPGPSTCATSSGRCSTLDVPPDTETLQQIASTTGGTVVHGPDRRGPEVRLRQPPVAHRLHRTAPGSHLRARRRRAAARRRRCRTVGGLVRPAAVGTPGRSVGAHSPGD